MEYTHLMMSGGAFYGYIYVGIYRFLKEYNLLKSIKYIYGTSIGAIATFLIALDIDYVFIEEILKTPDKYFKDPYFTELDPNNIFNLKNNFGFYNTHKLRKPLEDILEKVYTIRDITFSEFLKKTGKDIHINATCVNTGDSIDFCNENFPDMSVLTAIEASICIPFIFKPVQYKENLYIDGGTTNNLPLHLISNNISHKLLAINITYTNIKNIDNIYQYFFNVFSCLLKSTVSLEVYNHKNKDILTIFTHDVPMQPLSVIYKNNLFMIDYSKEEIDKAIMFGYTKLYIFFKEKGYL
jgi:predicted acylesterase/phospholipase RssA